MIGHAAHGRRGVLALGDQGLDLADEAGVFEHHQLGHEDHGDHFGQLGFKALLQLVERFGIVNINRSVFDEAPGFAEAVFGLLRAGRLQVPEAYSEAYAEFLLAESRPQEAPLASLVSQLTEKEAEIFACLLRGLSNTEISASTGIALSTTKWHLKNIYSKLNLSGRTEAILAMQQRGS